MKDTQILLTSLTAVTTEGEEWQKLMSQLTGITNKIISKRGKGVFYRLVTVPHADSPRGLVWSACCKIGEHVVWDSDDLYTTLPPQRGVQCHWYTKLEDLRIEITSQYRTLCTAEKEIFQQLQYVKSMEAAIINPVPTPLTYDLTAVRQERVRIKQEIIKLLK